MKVKNSSPGRLHFRGKTYAPGEEFSVDKEDLPEIRHSVEITDRRAKPRFASDV